ncbi:MAG: hypothetical protein DMG13_23430 [Acidobacteria bacterium]|nr:MAG: hypothetical protein DMG13_23430 [Acidobacteriota bacterium]
MLPHRARIPGSGPSNVHDAIGHFEFLATLLANPRHPEHDVTRTWVGGAFDPKAFDLEEVNRRLTSHSRRPSRTG